MTVPYRAASLGLPPSASPCLDGSSRPASDITIVPSSWHGLLIPCRVAHPSLKPDAHIYIVLAHCRRTIADAANMASAFTVSPNALHDHDHLPENPDLVSSSNHLAPSSTAADPDLSPLLSQGDFDSLSPPLNQFDTPIPSATSPSHHQIDEFGDLADPFFGANFNST